MIIQFKGRLVGFLLFGATALCLSPAYQVASGSQRKPNANRSGNAVAGRIIFNGKGVCYYCHGVNGDRTRLPQIERATAALIAQLNPQPTDLRNLRSLRLKTDQARAKLIREGHEGTGMFPDPTMTDQELADTLAYLTLLRKEQHAKKS